MATKKVNIDIVAKDKSKRALNKVRGNLDSVKKSVFNLRNAFIGLGAGLAIRSLVNTGKEIENLKVRLKFLFGTAEEGAKAFDEMAKFASKVPFSLAEIQKGAGVLAVVSEDAQELAKNMELTGNVAAVTGLDFKTTAEQIQRSLSAGISAADLFRDRGVKSMLGFKAGATVSVEETREAFERVFGSGGKFAGATDELAKTFEGTLSMIGDKVFNFKRTILEAGFFPELKKQFSELDKFLANQSEALDKMAVKIGKGLAIAVKSLAESIKFVKENVDKFALALGALIALKVAGFFYAIATALASLTVGMKAFNFATKKNIIFGSMVVFAGAMGFLIKKFQEFKGELDIATMSMEELNKEIERVERAMRRGLNIKNLTAELAIYKKRLNDLVIEQAELNMKETAHLRIINKIKLATKDLSDTYENLLHKHTMSKPYQDLTDSVIKATDATEHMRVKQRLTAEQAGLITKETENLKDTYEDLLQKHTMSKPYQELTKAMEETQTVFGSFKKGFAEAMNVDIFEKFEEIGKKTFDSLTKMLSDFVMTGKMNFQDFARTITRMIVEALIGKAVSSAVDAAVLMWKNSALREAMMDVYGAALRAFKNFGGWPFGVMAAGATVAFGMGLVNKMKGFAEGGRPPVNQPSIVGEKGPELFIPDRSGTIVPNNQLGGKPVTVNFNINTVDARGFNELLVNSRGVIVNMINSAVNEKGRMAIV